MKSAAGHIQARGLARCSDVLAPDAKFTRECQVPNQLTEREGLVQFVESTKHREGPQLCLVDVVNRELM